MPPSRSFTATYENECVTCKQPILIGQTIRFRTKGSRDLEHEACPKLSAPPVGSSRGQEGPKPGVSLPPAAAFSDAPIYTYHRRLNIWRQGLEAGWVELGVSTRGRSIMDVEIAEVDDRVRKLSRLNETGEVYK